MKIAFKKKDLSHDKQVLEVINSIEKIENLRNEDIELIQLYIRNKNLESN